MVHKQNFASKAHVQPVSSEHLAWSCGCVVVVGLTNKPKPVFTTVCSQTCPCRLSLVKQNAGLLQRWYLWKGCVHYDMVFQSCVKRSHSETWVKLAPALSTQFWMVPWMLAQIRIDCTELIGTSWVNVKSFFTFIAVHEAYGAPQSTYNSRFEW